MARLFDDSVPEYLRNNSTPATAVPLTLACWAYCNDLAGLQVALGINDWDADEAFSIGLSGDTGGDPVNAFTTAGGSNSVATSSSGMTANTWHHICGVFAANDDRAAYIDGGSKGTQSQTRTPANLDTILIGSRATWEAIDRSWSGGIAGPAIWTAALSDAEVLALFKGTDPRLIRPASLVAYWPLIRTLQDYVGGYHLTATGTAVADHPAKTIYVVPHFVFKPPAAGPATVEGTAILSGAGALSGVGMVEISGSAALSGAGALSSQSLNIALAQAALSGTGALSAVGVRVAVGAATLSGTGALSAIALNIAQGQSALSGTGSLDAIALNIALGNAALSGTGALSAIGAVLGVVEGAAALSGSGDLAAIALNIALGNTVLSGTGSLAAIGEILGTVEGAVLLSGSGDLSAIALNIAQGQAALSGSGDLSGAALLTIPSQALLSGTGSLSAIGNTVSGVLVLGLAVLSGVGTLSAGGDRFFTPTWREFEPSAETRTYTPSGGRTSTVEAKN